MFFFLIALQKTNFIKKNYYWLLAVATTRDVATLTISMSLFSQLAVATTQGQLLHELWLLSGHLQYIWNL